MKSFKGIKKILVADDQKSIRTAFQLALSSLEYTIENQKEKANFELFFAVNGQEALEIIEKEKPDLAILDIRMPIITGLVVLEEIQKRKLDTFAIIITAHGDLESTIQSMKLGAYDFVSKPIDLENITGKIFSALKTKEDLDFQKKAVQSPHYHVSDKPLKIVGTNPKMLEIYKTIGKIAGTNVTVLITGESGTGKELIAKAIHEFSNRSQNNFIAVNCTAIPQTLIESEFFGHIKGSFTGAINTRIGKFEMASGGTLFLDEIGDINLDIQAKLLRVLQEREITKVGDHIPQKIDVRIISATNRDMEKAIAENKFRTDLYHRIKVITIDLPPLRERIEDIEPLAEHFLKRFASERQININEESLDILKKYSWPGNIRELENVIESAVALSRDNIILPEHLPEQLFSQKIMPVQEVKLTYTDSSPVPSNDPMEEQLDVIFKHLVEKAIEENSEDLYAFVIEKVEGILINRCLSRCDGNQVKASNILGINRHTLRNKIQKLEIQLKKF